MTTLNEGPIRTWYPNPWGAVTKPDDTIDLFALQRDMMDARAEMALRNREVDDAHRRALEARERWVRACSAYYAAKDGDINEALRLRLPARREW